MALVSLFVLGTFSKLVFAQDDEPTCPSSDSTVYTAASGAQFTIECDVDHQGGDLAVTNVYSLLQCITDCDNTTGCVDVSLSGVACYMKSSLGAAISANGVFGARLNVAQTPAACPQSNNTIVSSSNGAEFLVECGIDHASGDMGWKYVSETDPLDECITACAETDGCRDISLSGTACYLKSSVGPRSYNSAISGARLITLPNGSSASSSSSSLSTSSFMPATPTSSTIPTSTALSCPASNGTYYVAESGLQFLIDCDTDYPGGDMLAVKATSFEECIEACDDQVDCSALVLSGVGCYEKSTVSGLTYGKGLLAARLVTSSVPSLTQSTSLTASATAGSPPLASLPCPASDGSSYTAANGESFVIECSMDHPGGNLDYIGLSGPSETWFAQCIEACASSDSCVDVSLSGSACYRKSSLGPASPADGIMGARLLTNATTTTSAPHAASASPTETAYPAPEVFVRSFEYLACYNDSVTNRTLQGAFLYGSSPENMTLETCAEFCEDFGYFGVEYMQECYCGSELLNNAIEQDRSSCYSACAGNDTQNCGGDDRMSLYRNMNFTAVASSSASASSSSITAAPITNLSGSTSLATTAANSTGPAVTGLFSSSIASASGFTSLVSAPANSTVPAATGILSSFGASASGFMSLVSQAANSTIQTATADYSTSSRQIASVSILPFPLLNSSVIFTTMASGAPSASNGLANPAGNTTAAFVSIVTARFG